MELTVTKIKCQECGEWLIRDEDAHMAADDGFWLSCPNFGEGREHHTLMFYQEERGELW